MNITFLIGNGFDINLGLNTRYTDFYPYYLSHKHDDMIFQAVEKNYDCWADLELALGQFLSNVTPDQVSEFLNSKAILESDLADHLRLEEQRIDVSSETVQKNFQKNITEFYNEFSSNDKNEFFAWKKTINGGIFYQFVSFNYTKALDNIVKSVRCIKQFGSHDALSNGITKTYDDKLGSVVHLHGTLSSELILGLDNVKQIDNSELQASRELTDYIIKKTVNEALGEGKTESARQLIYASNYVCVYGMSLGDTDLMWWRCLADWLNEKSSRRLVLYVYEEATTNPSASEKLRQQNRWKDTFLKIARTKPEFYDKLRSQIIVVLRSKIFDFSDIKLSPRQLEEELANV